MFAYTNVSNQNISDNARFEASATYNASSYGSYNDLFQGF